MAIFLVSHQYFAKFIGYRAIGSIISIMQRHTQVDCTVECTNDVNCAAVNVVSKSQSFMCELLMSTNISMTMDDNWSCFMIEVSEPYLVCFCIVISMTMDDNWSCFMIEVSEPYLVCFCIVISMTMDDNWSCFMIEVSEPYLVCFCIVISMTMDDNWSVS